MHLHLSLFAAFINLDWQRENLKHTAGGGYISLFTVCWHPKYSQSFTHYFMMFLSFVLLNVKSVHNHSPENVQYAFATVDFRQTEAEAH